MGRKYTYRPPRAHHRLVLGAVAPRYGDALASVDLRSALTPVRDQGREGDCFAFTGAALKEFNCAVWGGGVATPLGAWLSPAYLAWRVRLEEGTFPSDAGASLADTLAVLQQYGVCPESFLPYQMDPAQAGDASCDVAALPYRVAQPQLVDFGDVAQVKAVLSAKKVIAMGFTVYPSFEATGQDGIVSPVGPDEGLIGGHAVLLVGYDQRGWIIRNSWGSSWGDGGYCYQPYGYEDHWLEAWTTS